ncbi:hypothetical protein RFI_10200 [Reticulomyxa filosa]|uniref:Uncharacterized protein n=1 Tax=Reticulomyxa filosa TaxID=46433 RepID=X6NM02_RETFI|nr:hypothetical protein RFI_10200 [Reticulomyxa filosa]|eukprot:ETO26933.1 hypothetical protein RFI_10200 [Reticulomyxa filosa]
MTLKLSEKTCDYDIRKATKADLSEIFRIILNEPRHRIQHLARVSFFDVTISGSVLVIGIVCMGLLTVVTFIRKQPLPMVTYVSIIITPILVMYFIVLIKAYILFKTRYKKILNLTKLNISLSSEELDFYVESHCMYMAYEREKKGDNTRKEEKMCLGVLIMTTYPNYCASVDFNPLCLKELNECPQSAMVIEWLVINERIVHGNDHCCAIYEAMLQYVCQKDTLQQITRDSVEVSNINYVVCVCDDMLTWQHTPMTNNNFKVCGKWEDLHLFGSSFPTRYYFFIKTINVVSSHRTKSKKKNHKNCNSFFFKWLKPALVKGNIFSLSKVLTVFPSLLNHI